MLKRMAIEKFGAVSDPVSMKIRLSNAIKQVRKRSTNMFSGGYDVRYEGLEVFKEFAKTDIGRQQILDYNLLSSLLSEFRDFEKSLLLFEGDIDEDNEALVFAIELFDCIKSMYDNCDACQAEVESYEHYSSWSSFFEAPNDTFKVLICDRYCSEVTSEEETEDADMSEGSDDTDSSEGVTYLEC